MVTKVISEPKSDSRLKILPENWTQTINPYLVGEHYNGSISPAAAIKGKNDQPDEMHRRL